MMKRSRRSLGLLLASMACSLLILRATTGGVRKTISHGGGAEVCHGGVLNAATSKTVAQPMPRQITCTVEPAQAAFKRRPVSMTAVIVLLPQAPAVDATPPKVDEWQFVLPKRRAGWSGCVAYENGCDHLGCACVARRPARVATERLFFSAIQQVVSYAGQAASATVDLVCLAAAASDEAPSLASDFAKPRTER